MRSARRVFFIRFCFFFHWKKRRTKLLLCIINPAFVRCCETPFSTFSTHSWQMVDLAQQIVALHALFLCVPGACIGLRNSSPVAPCVVVYLEWTTQRDVFCLFICMPAALKWTLLALLAKPLCHINTSTGFREQCITNGLKLNLKESTYINKVSLQISNKNCSQEMKRKRSN